MAIKLVPPAGLAPYRSITLSSGNIARPDFARGGTVIVQGDADAVELESEGWTRLPTLLNGKLAKRVDAIRGLLVELQGRLQKIEAQALPAGYVLDGDLQKIEAHALPTRRANGATHTTDLAAPIRWTKSGWGP